MLDSLIHRATTAAAVCALLAACGNRADTQQGYQPPVKQEATLSRSTFQQHIQVRLKGTPYFAAQTVLPLNADQHKFYSFQVALPLAVPAWGESDSPVHHHASWGQEKFRIRDTHVQIPCACRRVLYARHLGFALHCHGIGGPR